jgi:hypothetical protein
MSVEETIESSLPVLLERWVSSGKYEEISFADWLKTR